MDIVLTLVFSIVMLLFMSVPAMKVATIIQKKWQLDDRWHMPMVLFFTALFSLMIGIFLRFA
jgi:hypothetical protein